MVHQVDGKLVQTFKHPSTVYGCDWNPNNENIIATACEDGQIRVFYVGSGTDQPLKTLSGHEGKAFKVKWSPLKDGILCSTSDDCSVRIWHYASGIAIRVLEGHCSYTRGLLWCPELPNVLITGSWDSTIRVWDISDGACLDVIEDHGADVYGLACHPGRPFVLVSTSRDSTVRIWSVLPLVSSLYLRILASHPLCDIFSPTTTDASEDFSETLGLYGIHSKSIKEHLSKTENGFTPDVLRKVSALFCPPFGTSNFWDLVLVLKNMDIDISSYKKGIVHKKHVVKLTLGKALEKELATVSFFGSGVNSCGKQDNLLQAAECHLLSGGLKKFCDLKVQAGEWLEAIALSPAVSLSYWKELSNKYLLIAKEENNALVAPLCIATGQIDELVKYYMKQNLLEKAHVVAVAASEGLLPSCAPVITEDVKDNKTEGNRFDSLAQENIKNLSERCIQHGYPIRAACWHLSYGEIQEALYCLLRGNELELAVSLCLSLGVENSSLRMALNYLSWRCVQKNEWELALDILSLSPETQIYKIRICINCELSVDERDQLHKKVGLPAVKECLKLAETVLPEEDIQNVVQYYLLSNEPRKGLEMGLKYVKEVLNEPRWNLESIWQLLYTMSCVPSSLLQEISYDSNEYE